MLIYQKLSGKWNSVKREYEFSSESERLIYKGRVAYAGGGSRGGSTSEVVATGPWQQQIPYVNMLFDQAASLYRGGPPQYYDGQLTPDVNPMLQGSWDSANAAVNANTTTNRSIQDSLVATANNAGTNSVNAVSNQIAPNIAGGVNQLISGNNAALNTGNAVQGNVVGAIQNAGGAAPQTQFGQVNAAPALDRALNSNGLNPFTDQIVNAALRSSNENFQQNVIPSLRREAGAANQSGGTREGIAQGIAARGLQNQQTDVISRLYGQAFDAGSADRNAALGLVAQGQGQNVNAALMGRGQGLQGAQIGADLLTRGSDLSQQATSTGTAQGGQLLMGGNSQAMDQYYRSLGMIPQVQAGQMAQYGFQNQSGLQQYGIGQANIDANMDRYFYNTLAPYNALTQFQNYIAGQYGSSLPGAGSLGQHQQATLPRGYTFNSPPPGTTTPTPPMGGFPNPGGTPPQTGGWGSIPPVNNHMIQPAVQPNWMGR